MWRAKNNDSELQTPELKNWTFDIPEVIYPNLYLKKADNTTSNVNDLPNGQGDGHLNATYNIAYYADTNSSQVTKTASVNVNGLASAAFPEDLKVDVDHDGSKDGLPLGKYVITETTVPTGCLKDNSSYTVYIEYDASAQEPKVRYVGFSTNPFSDTMTMVDTPQRGNLDLQKTDAELERTSDSTQGMATLAGAVYGIYNRSRERPSSCSRTCITKTS